MMNKVYSLKRRCNFDEMFVSDCPEVVTITTTNAVVDEDFVTIKTFSFQRFVVMKAGFCPCRVSEWFACVTSRPYIYDT